MNMWMRTLLFLAFANFCWLSVAGSAAAADANADTDSDALAKKVQNPIANLVTVPFQYNYFWEVETAVADSTFNRNSGVINIQPVIPFPGEKWNVISRTIIPINSVPVGVDGSIFGLGDINLSLFWSPAKASPLTWGVGPIFYIPLSSNPEKLGTGKFSLGPTGVVFYGVGKWTMGGVASIAWSIFGDDSRDDFNLFVSQYFLNYNLGSGWALGTAPIITGNLEADSGQQWTVPFGLQISKIARLGSRPANLLFGYYYNVEHPDGVGEKSIRLQVNLMYP